MAVKTTLNAVTHPVLYSFRRCPYAMRARLALKIAGIECELREVVLRDRPDHLYAISPKGTVPVLQLTDGTVIDESLDIMVWALKQNDPEDWLIEGCEDTEFLITRNDGGFKKALDRYKYPNRYPDEDCSGARDTCQAVFEDLNARLEKNAGYLVTNRATLADYVLFPFIRQCAKADMDFFNALPLPQLQTWLETHLNSALFTSIMKKYAQWQPGADAIYFATSD